MNSNGGNDYWETGVMRPDLLLGDLIKIFPYEGVITKIQKETNKSCNI